MAGVFTYQDGRRRIDFTPPGHKRQTIRLGVVSATEAGDFARRIERLIRAKKLGDIPDVETTLWARRIDRKFYEQLARVGLVEKRDVFTVGQLANWFTDLKSRRVKAATLRNLKITTANMVAYFGADTPLEAVTMQQADAFRKWLLEAGGKSGGHLAAATVSRRCRRASEIFEEAVTQRWINVSPFVHMGNWCEVNETRDRYVGADVIEALMDETPDIHLRLMLALSRYAGLRGLGEFVPLEWSWVDWSANTMQVLAPKTEQYAGKKYRVVPIFHPLRCRLDACWEKARVGQSKVFSVLPDKHSAISGRVATLCRKLNLPLWPKPFTNLRASCERDWINQQYDINVVASWMGHSPETMLRHYSRFGKQRIALNAAKLLQPPKSPFAGQQPEQHFDTSDCVPARLREPQ